MARLARMAGAISQVAPDAATFGKELRDAGGFEGMMETFYRLAAFTGLYDETSHFGGIHINIAARCMGGDKNTESPAAKGCSHRYDAGDYAINGPDSAGAKRPTKANIASILEYLLR
jgi:hypothetical protein